MTRVAILAHKQDGFWNRPYVLQSLFETWNSWDIEVEVIEGPQKAQNADLAFLHVDQTHVPPEYLALAATYPRCINRYTQDISKRFISRNLVEPKDDFAGPVIVKSNYNSGGWIEAHKAQGKPGFTPRHVSDYQIFDRKSDVADEIWSDRSLVVEKYRPEVVDGNFCLRLWHFFGSCDVVSRLISDEPIVRADTAISREQIGEVPDSIRALREELGFDYGKFDFGFHEGEAVLYDANRTPGYGILTPELAAARSATLAPGIKDFL